MRIGKKQLSKGKIKLLIKIILAESIKCTPSLYKFPKLIMLYFMNNRSRLSPNILIKQPKLSVIQWFNLVDVIKSDV